MVLPISERSYVPLDPLNRLTPAEKESLASLKQIAIAHRREARSRVASESRTSVNTTMITTLMYVLGFIVVVALAIYFFRT